MAKKVLTIEQQIHAIPIRNKHIEVFAGEQGGVELEVTLRYPTVLKPLTKLLGARRKRRFLLDEVGREVYDEIDGQRSVEELIDHFADRHALTFFEARAFLAQYLRTLMKNGLVAVGVPKS